MQVFSWRKSRFVVVDPSIQPVNTEFILLYFVEGNALCLRRRADEEMHLIPVKNQWDHESSLSKFEKWSSINPGLAREKSFQTKFEVEEPPARKKKCPECDGSPRWSDAVVKPSYGVKEEGPNIIESCRVCSGSGYVDNVF